MLAMKFMFYEHENFKTKYIIRSLAMINPFRKRTGILPSYFTGRKKELNELNEIYQSTKNGVPSHLILYGSKGSGKTCTLLKFEEEISNLDNVYPVRIPLFEGNFEDIYTLIIEKCCDTLNINFGHFWQKITSSGINIPFAGVLSQSPDLPKTSPVIAFEKILSIIYDELKSEDPVLILLFDDLQKIMINEDSLKILSIIQNALVELNLQGKNIMFVAASSDEIFFKVQDKLDSSLGIFEHYLIEPLSYNEVYEAINIAVKKENVSFSEEVIKEIYELSDGIPYYMQILAYSCFEENNELTVVEFEKSLTKTLNILAQREFKVLFDKSTTEERKILCLMAESSEKTLSYTYIKDNANLNSEPSSLLKNLIDKNMIIKPKRGKYQLKNSLVKLYLQNLQIQLKKV